MTAADATQAQPAPELSATASTRSAAIDHVRIVLTGLVILHHVAITYGGAGSWYWRAEPESSSLPLVVFNATNQAFFMGFFFLLAGYFTPGSCQRKGVGLYLQDRFIRLGIPLVVYFFVISPFTVALANRAPGDSFLQTWWQMTLSAEFGPGPLWFAEALLLFALAYAAWRVLRPRDLPMALPGPAVLVLISLCLAVVTFVVRLFVPVGKEVAWLQLGYFPAYIALFAAGCALNGRRALDKVNSARALPWMVISVLMVGLICWVIQHPLDNGRFEGGVSLNALFYALWDPFTAWGFILGMLWACQRFASRQTLVTGWLARRAFGAYIVHPPVVVAASVLLAPWPASPMPKFIAVGAMGFTGSFALAALLLYIPGSKRVL